MKYLQSLTNRDVFQSVRKTSVIVSGWLCTIGGFVADVLQPIAPFAHYLFFLSIAGLAILVAVYAMGRKHLLGAVALAAIASLATGVFALLQQGGESEERGIVATAFPMVASLQERLGLIDQKLDALKQDTESLRGSALRIESKSDQMLDSLDAIKRGIGSASGGGIIADPKSPEDHYHNARIQELDGSYSAARRSYLEYFKGELPKLDPHLRFIDFLKVQEGTAGAREAYNNVAARNPTPLSDYARILLLNPEQRVAQLKQYQQEHPDFAPAAYHLSLEYSENRLGSQTFANQRDELAALSAFQSADEKGHLLRYLVDQDLVKQWRADAQERRLSIESGALSLASPVSVNWMPHNAGWTGTLQIGEPAIDIKWNLQGQTEPASTGSSGINDPRTGRPAPQSFFSLPKSQPEATIEIRYTDLSGAEQGPFAFPFMPRSAGDAANKRILESTSTAWLSFRDYQGSTLLYFTHLLVHRGALERIEYGIDRPDPDQAFAFPAWEKPGMAEIDGSFPIMQTVPSTAAYATARLVYKDGSRSQVMRFDR